MTEEKFVAVDRNGKKQTGPLPESTALKVARDLGGHIEPVQEPRPKQNYNDLLWMVVLVSLILGISAGLLSQSVSIGFWGGLGALIFGLFGLIWSILTNSKS